MKLNLSRINVKNAVIISGDVDDFDTYWSALPDADKAKCKGYFRHFTNCDWSFRCGGSCTGNLRCGMDMEGAEFACDCRGSQKDQGRFRLPELRFKDATAVPDGDIDAYLAAHPDLKGKARIFITPQFIECRGQAGAQCTFVLEEETQTIFCHCE